MVLRDPHISFVVLGVHHHSRRCCTATRTPIDGNTVMGVSKVSEPMALCSDLLGHSHGDDGEKFTSSRFSWLKANFEYLLRTTTEREVICIA